MRIIETVAWIHVVDRRVLMVRARGRPVFFMPGGKPEPGEDDEAALRRELQEEVAVDVIPGSLRFVCAVEAPAFGHKDTLVRMRAYGADVVGEPRPSGEIDLLRFVGSADLDVCPPAGRLVVEHLVAAGVID